MSDSAPSDGEWTPEHLQAEECWTLLRSRDLGRLAFVLDGQTEIFPINYVVHAGSLVFRTSRGNKLSAVRVHSMVAFEVDGEDEGVAWSVIVKGRVREITHIHDAEELAELPLYPRQDGRKGHVVELGPGEITGRRFSIVKPPARSGG